MMTSPNVQRPNASLSVDQAIADITAKLAAQQATIKNITAMLTPVMPPLQSAIPDPVTQTSLRNYVNQLSDQNRSISSDLSVISDTIATVQAQNTALTTQLDKKTTTQAVVSSAPPGTYVSLPAAAIMIALAFAGGAAGGYAYRGYRMKSGSKAREEAAEVAEEEAEELTPPKRRRSRRKKAS